MDEITRLMQECGGVLRTREAQAAGISRARLAELVKNGMLERVAQGQYVLPDEIPDELYLLQRRSGKLVFSHETALFLHGLSDRTPTRPSITVPSGYKLSTDMSKSCKAYYIKPDLLLMGVMEMDSRMGHEVRCYDQERTLCDAVRSRNKMDNQLVVDAIRQYAQGKRKDLNRLSGYAKQLGVERAIMRYLEVLL